MADCCLSTGFYAGTRSCQGSQNRIFYYKGIIIIIFNYYYFPSSFSPYPTVLYEHTSFHTALSGTHPNEHTKPFVLDLSLVVHCLIVPVLLITSLLCHNKYKEKKEREGNAYDQ